MELPGHFGPVNTRREGTDREPEGEPSPECEHADSLSWNSYPREL